MIHFSIAETYGALILGSLIASSLFGVTTMQAIIYFRLYPKDSKYLKALVGIVWIIDATHTAFLWYGMWYYFIQFFADVTRINLATPMIIGLTFTTLIQTFIVHCFYVLRIFRLSQRKYWLAVPIFILSIARVAVSCVSIAVLISLQTFSAVAMRYNFILPIGLIIGATVDVLIMTSMFVLLRKRSHQTLSLKNVVDKLILYTFEVGSLTALASILCMITYFAIPRTFIFLGIYFSVPKLYANSFLASLNTRYHLRNLEKTQVHQMSTRAAAVGTADPTKSTAVHYLSTIHFDESDTRTDEEKAVQDAESSGESSGESSNHIKS